MLSLAIAIGLIPCLQEAGSVGGRITFDGDAPEARRVAVPENAVSCCGTEAVVQPVLVDEASHGLRWVYVEITGVPNARWAPEADAAYELDQQGCVFTPHVLVVPPGATLTLRNSDTVLHNINAACQRNAPFNVGIPQGGSTTQVLRVPETVTLNCDVHAWMRGYVIVTRSPFHALTGEDGAFEIAGVPAGHWRLKIWHEACAANGQEQEIDVQAGGRTEVSVALRLP